MTDPFKNWREDQTVFDSVSIASMKKKVTQKHVERLRRQLRNHVADLLSPASFFSISELSNFLSSYKIPKSDLLKKHFCKIYEILDRDIGEFIDHLEASHFVSKSLNARENSRGVDPTTKKYTDWFSFLFDCDDEDEEDQLLFEISNRFFEFCFYPKTFGRFKKMLKNSEYYPILRMFYATMWSNMAETGWQHWHKKTLDSLKKLSYSGKEIIYVAGGTDIYQLIKHGIYNIRVIDPMLPTQPKYYSGNWEWFVKGEGKNFGVGEELAFDCGGKKITMKRVAYKPTKKRFTITLSNDKEETFCESVTEWHLLDSKKKLLGKIFFDRRLTGQEDFSPSTKQALLISFNELNFIAATKEHDGWGINPHKFKDNFVIYVKQLEKPVTKQVVCNIRHEIAQDDFAFISLGSCIN